MRRARGLTMGWAAIASAWWGCGGATVVDAAPPEPAAAWDRGAIAEQLAAVEAARGAGRSAEALARLAAIWPHRKALAYDRVIRDVLVAIPVDGLPGALAEGQAVERAQAALGAGRLAEAEAWVEAVARRRWTAASWTEARARIIYGLAVHRRDQEAARQRLLAVANEPPPGEVGEALGHLARLTVAGSFLDAGRLREAIAAYLRVPATSGYYRAARFGLATCQLRAGRHERALKILALLPGGLVGDPERAVIAALAADAWGRTDAAAAIVEGALARADVWAAGRASPEAVLVRVARGRASASEGMLETVATAPTVRRAAAEVLATRAEIAREGPHRWALMAYGERVEAALRRVVAAEVRLQAARVERAWDSLRALRTRLASRG